MGKKSRLKKERREGADGGPLMWGSEDGVQALGVGQTPSLLETAAMTELPAADSEVASLG
jgi:hypothetical protein